MTPVSAAQAVKRRQMLLLSAGVLIVVGAAAIGVAVTSGGKPMVSTMKPKSVPIMSPGAQVDPKDAWTATAGVEIHTLTEKNKALQNQANEMMDRLKRVEADRLKPQPLPDAVTAAAAVAGTLPGAAGQTAGQRVLGTPVGLPPGAPPQALPPAYGASPYARGPNGLPPVPSTGLVTVALAPPKDAPGKTAGAPGKNEVKGTFLPSGSFARAVLLGGIDAPTGGQAQRNPQPVLLRLQDNAVLPNRYRYAVKECFIVGAAYGDISSERGYIRTETLSCVTHKGEAIDIPLKGYVAGEDGKAGMRGRLVSKQGQILANALLAGVVAGIGQGFRDSSTTTAISPLGAVQSTKDGREFEAGVAGGVGKALDRLAQYYISLAEKTFPVIEIDAGREVDVVVTKGVTIDGLGGPDDALAEAE